jgi:hypothetical protein
MSDDEIYEQLICDELIGFIGKHHAALCVAERGHNRFGETA